MSDGIDSKEAPMPEEVAFALRTRTLIKMGIPFDDPRMQLAVTQLGLWPQLLFDFQRDGEGKFLMEVRIDEVQHVLDFNVVLETIPEVVELEARASNLFAWCQQLLGEDWAVHFNNRKRKNGKYKLIARADRLKPLEAHPLTLTDAPFPDAVTKFQRYRTDKKFGFDEKVDLGPILPAKR